MGEASKRGKGSGRGKAWRRAVGVLTLALLAAGAVFAWRSRPVEPVERARLAYAGGRYREALDLSYDAAKAAPEDRRALRLAARASARLGRDREAAGLFERAGAADADAEDFALLAGSLVRLGRPADAELLLRRALDLDPTHEESLDLLARLYASGDRLAEAATLAERLARIPGWEPDGSARLGLVREAQGDPAGAASALRAALNASSGPRAADLRPGPLRRRLVRALLKLGRPDEAAAELGRIVPDGDDPEVHWLRSRVALQRGDAAAAIAAWERAAAVTPGGEPAAHAAEEPAPFVGAERCAECHRDVHDDQQSSRHALTFRRAAEVDPAALPAARRPDPGDPSVTLEAGPTGLSAQGAGGLVKAVTAYVMGSGRHARTPLGRDESGTWRELRLTHYAEIDSWDITPGHPARPAADDRCGHLGEAQTPDTLRRCLGCHTTNAHAILAEAAPSDAPETRDRGIGCERCHGPGGNHAKAAALKFPDLAIARFRPGRSGVRAGVMKNCGGCHGTEGRQLPGADPAATVRFQGTTLTWSRCYVESRGRLDCLSCHDAHRSADEPVAAYDARCLACHGPAADAGGDGPPRTACPVNPRSDCVGCHMPRTRSIVPHATFTDHHIRVHPESVKGR